MQKLGLAISCIVLAVAGSKDSGAQGCFPPPRRDGVDFSLPCIPLSPIADEHSIVYFDSGSAELTAEAKSILALQADSLHAHPRDRVQLIGSTDTLEATTSREKGELARKRAIAARAYLIDLGIHASRIVAIGRDYSSAITDTPDEAVQAPLRQVRTELLR